MPRVICGNTYCIHNDEFECTKDYLNVEADFVEYDGDDIRCFEPYYDQPDYQEEYWKRIQKDGKTYKSAAKGKKVEVNGIVLYTSERLPPEALWSSENTVPVFCTESITGMGVSLHNALVRADDIKNTIRNTHPPVCELEEYNGE